VDYSDQQDLEARKEGQSSPSQGVDPVPLWHDVELYQLTLI